MPARGKRELPPRRIDDVAGALASQQVPFEEVLLAATASRRRFRRASLCLLVRPEPLQDVDGGRERGSDRTALCVAVPAAVLELLAKEAGHYLVDVLTEIGTECDGPAVDTRLDFAAEERLAGMKRTTRDAGRLWNT